MTTTTTQVVYPFFSPSLTRHDPPLESFITVFGRTVVGFSIVNHWQAWRPLTGDYQRLLPTLPTYWYLGSVSPDQEDNGSRWLLLPSSLLANIHDRMPALRDRAAGGGLHASLSHVDLRSVQNAMEPRVLKSIWILQWLAWDGTTAASQPSGSVWHLTTPFESQLGPLVLIPTPAAEVLDAIELPWVSPAWYARRVAIQQEVEQYQRTLDIEHGKEND